MLYTAPQEILVNWNKTRVFIAGGISGCGDWQSEIIDVIDTDLHDVYNPRRPGGLEKDGEEAKRQIKWEYDALATVNDIVFWFPKESICPITLLEYGKMLERAAQSDLTTLILGYDPDYARAFDLEVQTELVQAEFTPKAHWFSPKIVVTKGFEAFKAAVQEHYGVGA